MTDCGRDLRFLRVVVVAYGDPQHLAKCLDSLGGDLDVCVVDNSSDSEVAAIAHRHKARYDDPGSNLGFGGAVNRVLRRTIEEGEPRDVLLLNPDALITGPQVMDLQSFLLASSGCGGVTPRLLTPNGRSHREAWPFPTPARAWAEAVGVGRCIRTSGFVVGAVLLLRWETLLDVGLFDEQFFLYAEETDWQRRAKDSGWRSEVCRGVTAVHIGAASSTDPWLRELLFHAGSETYVRKWFGAWGWWSYRTAVLMGCLLRLLVPGERRPAALTRALIYWRGPSRLAASVRSL